MSLFGYFLPKKVFFKISKLRKNLNSKIPGPPQFVELLRFV